MLVLIGPSFQGTDNQYAQLSDVTGLVQYELRTRLRQNSWGLLKAIAEEQEAEQLAFQLRTLGYEAVAVDPSVGQDEQRQIVSVCAIQFGAQCADVQVRTRSMVIPYAAFLTIVRGEVVMDTLSEAGSESRFRASRSSVLPPSPQATTGRFDSFIAADIHFCTVNWIGRIDSRHFDFSEFELHDGNPIKNLDRVTDHLAERAGGIPVDRCVKRSSVAGFVAPPSRSSQPPTSVAADPVSGDSRFDSYSRIIGEAERKCRAIRRAVSEGVNLNGNTHPQSTPQ